MGLILRILGVASRFGRKEKESISCLKESEKIILPTKVMKI